jgi:hypothetical protein
LGRPVRRSLHLGRGDLAPTLDLGPSPLYPLARLPLWAGHARRHSLFYRLGSCRHETSKALQRRIAIRFLRPSPASLDP